MIIQRHCRSVHCYPRAYYNNNMYDLDPNCTHLIRIMRVRVCALSFEINIIPRLRTKCCLAAHIQILKHQSVKRRVMDA